MAGALDIARAVPAYAALRRSQRWPGARLDALVAERLSATLSAAARIPFYAHRFADSGLRGLPRREDIPRIPPLQRGEISTLLDSARARGAAQREDAVEVRSSGTTGEMVRLLVDRSHQRGRFAARMRYLRERGWSPLARTAWLLGVRPGNPDGDLAARGRLLGTRFLSHIDEIEAQLEVLTRMRPRFLYTLPSALEGLVALLEERGGDLPGLERVFTGGEVLEDALRARARACLGVDVADNYGSTEAFLAWECEAGSYHVNAEHVLLEVVDEAGAPAAPGALGRVLVTTLENRAMPLLRWEIGDYAEVVEGACPCGRTLPRIGRIHGRVMNLFRLPDGRLMSPWRLVEAVKKLPPLRAVQVVQRALDRYVVRVVCDEPLAPDVEGTVRAAVCEQVGGEVQVAVERVAVIERTARGKFLASLCEIGA